MLFCLRGQPQQLRVEIRLAGEGEHVVRGEHDVDPARARLLDDDVDGCGLQLHHERVGVDPAELGAQRCAVGEAAGDVRDVRAVELPQVRGDAGVLRRGRRAEERDAAAAEITVRVRPQHGAHDRHTRADERLQISLQSRVVDVVLRGRDHDEVGQERPVGVEVAGGDRAILVPADDEHAPGRGDGRQRRAAAVEHDQVGPERLGGADAREHVREPDGAGEAAAAAAAPDSRHAGERGRLEMVRRGVPSGAGERQQPFDGRRHRHRLGLGRASPTHRHDHDAPVGGERACHVPGDRRLADALPGADDGERGNGHGLEPGRVEAEVGALVGHAERQRAGDQAEALGRAQHRLVGEVEHELGRMRGDCSLEAGGERDAVVLTAAELLGASHEHGSDDLVRQLGERVAHDVGVVLAVDQGHRSHLRDLTSESIRPVYFSYSKVSVENWMIRSWPWNG